MPCEVPSRVPTNGAAKLQKFTIIIRTFLEKAQTCLAVMSNRAADVRRACGAVTQEEMVLLGAQKLVKGSPAAVAPQVVGRGPLPEEAVGWFLELYNASECSWHLAEVLAYRKSGRLHHLLYKDGEDEWVNLTREAIRWTQAAPLAPLGAGLRPGEPPPPAFFASMHSCNEWLPLLMLLVCALLCGVLASAPRASSL